MHQPSNIHIQFSACCRCIYELRTFSGQNAAYALNVNNGLIAIVGIHIHCHHQHRCRRNHHTLPSVRPIRSVVSIEKQRLTCSCYVCTSKLLFSVDCQAVYMDTKKKPPTQRPIVHELKCSEAAQTAAAYIDR